MIELYLERHYKTTPPRFEIDINGQAKTCHLIDQNPTSHGDRLKVGIDGTEVREQNSLHVFFTNKDHQDDNWIEIKNVVINGIGLDWLLYQCTEFRHDMPAEWLDHMRQKNIYILEIYRPGTVLRLAGKTTIRWSEPLWLYKTKEMAAS